MKLISEQKALGQLRKLKDDLRSEVRNYEHRAKNCLTCETPGACCLDAHFVNVHISRLEAKAIHTILIRLAPVRQNLVYDRIEHTVVEYSLSTEGDTFARTYACPLFEPGTGCLVHDDGKPVPCIHHACYENKADLPPDELQMEQERLIDDLNRRTYGRSLPVLPLPVAIYRHGRLLPKNGCDHESHNKKSHPFGRSARRG